MGGMIHRLNSKLLSMSRILALKDIMKLLELIDRLNIIHNDKGNIEILIEEINVDWECSQGNLLTTISYFDIIEITDKGIIKPDTKIIDFKIKEE